MNLRVAGFERALRGDEVFGWSFPASVYLRRLRDAPGLAPVIRADYYNALCEASDTAVGDARHEVRDQLASALAKLRDQLAS